MDSEQLCTESVLQLAGLCECRIHIKNVTELPEVVLDRVFGRRRSPTFREIALFIWDRPSSAQDHEMLV